MSRNRHRNRGQKKQFLNSTDTAMMELVAAVRLAGPSTGGSFLSGYDTQMFANNYALISLQQAVLSYMYTGNGLFQTAIEQPVLDAISKGVEIESGEMSSPDIEDLLDWFENHDLWSVIKDSFVWGRLYGGGAVVINVDQDPEKPLNLKRINKYSEIEFYDVDRWQLSGGYYDAYTKAYIGSEDFILFNGETLHKSRVVPLFGKRAPYYIRNQLGGWGMSEAERMLRDLNQYIKTNDVIFELLDEAKIDVYKIKGLANKLITEGAWQKVANRITAANMIKNYVNALVLDAEEEYEQKTMTFAGLADVLRENRIGIAAALRMPLTKLFGLSASGFNTGESDLENYNSKVESEIRKPLKPAIKQFLEIGCQVLFGYVPSFKIKFPSLRVLSAKEEEEIATSKTNRLLSVYSAGLIDAPEFMQVMRKEGVITIQTKAEQGLLPDRPIRRDENNG